MLGYNSQKALRHLKKADPRLAAVIKAAGPYQIRTDGTAFKSLSRAVFFQQLAGPAARAILGRVLALLETDEEKWYEPASFLAKTEEELRTAGLSRMKVTYLRDLSEKFDSGFLSEGEFDHLDDEAVIERVSAVKGIGRWTAEMFLMFSLGRPDVLPVGDLGVQKGMQVTYGLAEMPKADTMREIAEPWRPYRTVGTWYMWRSLGIEVPEQGRGFKKDAA